VFPISFSSRLRQAREQAGFTQQDLAEKLGITKSAVGNYENGVSSPKWDVLLRIFDVLQVEPNFLYQDSFSPELSGAVQLTPRQSALLSSFDQLNEEGQTKAVEYVEDLVLTGRYKKCSAPGLGAEEA
jgi:transcriptional regulator with XRE-family HTH domain